MIVHQGCYPGQTKRVVDLGPARARPSITQRVASGNAGGAVRPADAIPPKRELLQHLRIDG